MNLLTETVTKIGFGDGMNSIWTGLGNAWIILIPFGLFIIIKILNFFRHMVKGF